MYINLLNLFTVISDFTHPDASFAGSMQLMAAVKCGTNRRLANHPHFEDRELRDATREIYQMYARKTPNYVYNKIKKYNVDYIIVEDSICLGKDKPNYCSLKEILDIGNRHVNFSILFCVCVFFWLKSFN